MLRLYGRLVSIATALLVTSNIESLLNDGFQTDVAGLHSAFHSGRKHGSTRLSIGQSHSHSHQRACAVWLKSRFHMVVRRGIWEVHPLHMNNPAIWFNDKTTT